MKLYHLSWTSHWPVFILLCMLSLNAQAGQDKQQIQKILQSKSPPHGVVFEIVSGDEKGLQWALPRVQGYMQQLRKQFPGIELAIVTHGREQFALQSKKSGEYADVHDAVKKLSTEGEVPVHICQTFAGWRGVEPEDFPEYVSVSATGPQQVNDYKELGYIVVIISRR